LEDEMPALPWASRATVDADRDYVVMASRLPLARYRHLPGFLRATAAIRRQLAATDGLVGYSLDAHPLAKTFWTVSAWRSRAALEAFSQADPHHARVATIRTHMRPTTFVFWTCRGSDPPISWTEVRRRIQEQAR
jgi:heme-degrading monooxygenase HmoA